MVTRSGVTMVTRRGYHGNHEGVTMVTIRGVTMVTIRGVLGGYHGNKVGVYHGNKGALWLQGRLPW